MIGLVDWAAERARMVLAFIVLSLTAGALAYVTLPKEGEPDIEIPALFISVQFPGISAEDSESLLVQPMETELSDLDGLKSMSAVASENYAGVALEFEFGWNKSEIMADVRERMSTVEGQFPEGAENYTITEINFSEFPIVIVSLTGDVPERTLRRVAEDLQDRLEALEPVLEAGLAGHREEMVEVIIDPLRLEAYNVTAQELISVVVNNNQLIAAGEIDSPQGAFSVKIPASFDTPQDIYALPVKTNGDRVVTLGDLAEIRLTFQDREGTARFNGENTVALQVVKRRGFNIIDTANLVREEIEAVRATWPEELQQAVAITTSNDQSRTVESMVKQLEGSVLTAIALVMIVILATLGARSALLVGFAIPTSFLLCFVLLTLMGVTVSNIVMFGLILAVGMLVDGAIVVVEYADRRIQEGVGPMHAYVEAAKRMFWPIISSTATTLCAFLPMLFWPGVPGEFMGMLPVTLIFVLSASLVVALIYLPVMGGVSGRISRFLDRSSDHLRTHHWLFRLILVPPSLALVVLGMLQTINPEYLFGAGASVGILPGALIFFFGCFATSVTVGAAKPQFREKRIKAGYRRNAFGHLIHFLVGNPIMPIVAIVAVGAFVMVTFKTFGENNNGVEFFVESEPEQAVVYVLQRGNLSLTEKDAAVRAVEEIAQSIEGIESIFAFAGEGGLNSNTGGASPPLDSVGQVQIELTPWADRAHDPELDGDLILAELEAQLATLPGIRTEILNLSRGPASGKPVHLRLLGSDFDALQQATRIVRDRFDTTPGLADIEDTLPLPGIDWQIRVDVEQAGRYGANVATVGGMVQLVTRGLLLDTMRVDSSDEEIEIRVRLPEEDRVLSTLDTLKVRTLEGLVPLSNFITREPVPKLGQIDRDSQRRFFDVKAALESDLVSVEDMQTGDITIVAADLLRAEPDTETAAWHAATSLRSAIAEGDATATPITANERIETLTTWLSTEAELPGGVSWEWTGDQEDQAESGAFLQSAFMGALGLMFIILLAQFNSIYNSVLVLLAVILSTAGVLIGMLVMDQAFSIIMTGTGIVALAGIVVNNNIVLIDTYQEYSQYMPRIEAITRTAQARIRPVLLTTITTMAGLAPMMFGLSLDFGNGGYTIDSPTALWWKQLATAVVFGLGIATVLTLIFTPSMLALRVWVSMGSYRIFRGISALSMGRNSREAQDLSLGKTARKLASPLLLWDTETDAQKLAKAQAAKEELETKVSTLETEVETLEETFQRPDDPGPVKAAE
ncbi:efflux RND transporter permease subunit [Cochlodiniinecator piscidefendens]|uniref:efflux RND transporter permease subunit n=1 Tax=Cochlodiniinecator piscidefendens TaxID=2715756 RepID=UPI00140B120B|nr:efflux RND transporter permease subunit [Cochlodiniinecator piscidefendens]